MIDYGNVLCGACELELPVKDDVFICRGCMAKLPDDLRKEVLTAEEQYQYRARRKALEALGVAALNRKINLKRERKPRDPKCSCKNPLIMKQAGIFGGDETVCGNCCRRIVSTRRVMA